MRQVVVSIVTLVVVCAVQAADSGNSIEQLRKDLAELRRQADQVSKAPVGAQLDRALDSKYGPNAAVTSKLGKLTLGGLVQVWYYAIQNDNRGLFDDPNINGIADTNEALDNDSFRVRRVRLRFQCDLTENITSVVMIEPSAEASSFAPFNAPTGTAKRAVNVNLGAVQNGAGAVPRILQDAFINYHGVVPHHDFQIGQFQPSFGEDGLRGSGELDFVERSMIGQLAANTRDLGVQLHGAWLDNKVQYWLGMFNGAGNYHYSGGLMFNRADDNDAKDFNYRVAVRPIWAHETWGSLELGMSSQFGYHGEAGGIDPINAPINGLNRKEAFAVRHDAWAYYAPCGPVRGWWLRGEWGSAKDRNAPQSVIDLQGNDLDGDNRQDFGKTFSVQGWFFSSGYHLGKSIFAERIGPALRALEFTFRYDVFENVTTADLVNPAHTDTFKTQIWTGGANYYIRGHTAKIQLNYNWVQNPDGEDAGGNRTFHNTRNDNLVLNFQVAF